MSVRSRYLATAAPLLTAAAVVIVTGTAVTGHGAPPSARAAVAVADEKIDPAVLEDLRRSGGEPVPFWVVMAGGADLTGADRLTGKAARGAFVHETLTSFAASDQAAVLDLAGAAKAEAASFWITNTLLVTGDGDLVQRIADRPEVARIEPDPETTNGRPTPTPGGASSSHVGPVARAAERVEPADGIEWNIRKIGADRVWEEQGTRGEGIVIGLIDSGVRLDHPALAHSYRGRLSDGGTDNNYNFFDPRHRCVDDNPCDVSGHGTGVLGAALGATTDGAHRIGVAPGARWVAARACEDPGGCRNQDLLAAAQWMLAPTDVNGRNPRPDLAPDVVNNSWQRSGSPDLFGEVLDAWVAAGILPVVAAGNLGGTRACESVSWPASYPKAYTVGNFEDVGRMAADSSRGPAANGEIKPDISAPGKPIRTGSSDRRWVTTQGTSLAAPHVTGAVALLWSRLPWLQNRPATTREVLDGAATRLDETSCGGTKDDNNLAGAGLLDLPAAFAAAPAGTAAGVTGRVVDGEGRPVPDATVVLNGPSGRWARVGTDGTYRFAALSPGRYDYRVDAAGHREATGSVTIGADRTLDLTLEALPRVDVRGVVRAGGQPLAGARVDVANTTIHTTTGADGAYRLSVPAGSQDLVVRAADRCALPWSRTLDPASLGDGRLDVDLRQRAEKLLYSDTVPFGYTCAAPVTGYREGTTRLAITGRTGASRRLELPFSMPLFGQRYSAAWVSTTGAVGFTGPPEAPAGNAVDPIPGPWQPTGAVLPFYTALDVDDEAGVYVTSTAEELVVEWRNVAVLDVTGSAEGRISVSSTLRPDGSVTLAYRGSNGSPYAAGWNAVVGVQNETGDVAFAYGNLEEVVRDGLAFTIRPPAA